MGTEDPTAAPGRPARVNVFVSYTAADKAWATWVAWVLEDEGRTVAIEAWDAPVGTNLVSWIDQQMTHAERTVAICSQAYFASHWRTPEWTTALTGQTLIPLWVEDCTAPRMLAAIVHSDLHGIDETTARRRLLEALGLTATPRASDGFPGGPTSEKPPFPGAVPGKGPSITGFWRGMVSRARRHQRWAIGALSVTLVAVVIIVSLKSCESEDPESTATAPTSSAPAMLGQCEVVTIMTGQEGSPYNNYGDTLAGIIESEYSGTTVNVTPTRGSAQNLDALRDPNARCTLSIAQFTTAVDARYGAGQFLNAPIDRLRTVGPLWFDLLQLIVRADSDITTAEQLCSAGGTIATGLQTSGTAQIGDVLFRQIRNAVGPDCQLSPVPMSLSAGLAELGAGNVQAVLWSGGAPTSEIRQEATQGAGIRLLPLSTYRDAMQDEWDGFYRHEAGDDFVPGQIYTAEQIRPQDYPGAGPTATVGIPNGIVGADFTDPDLVGYTTRVLQEHRGEFERAIWPDETERHFWPIRRTVGTSPVYCFVPLHPAAKNFYEQSNISPRCSVPTSAASPGASEQPGQAGPVN
ncbi:TAXI family TRAP transporter solute-binding subunit [Parafrankia sp. FMc2]|uniref:TAXI family TRAP transporter solute-binding subunit n=1 Tax=Parafrankia sp. FMc2 TaxID=3233196 RepID=UPI0034D51309